MNRLKAQVIPLSAHRIRCSLCRLVFRGATAVETTDLYLDHKCCEMPS